MLTLATVILAAGAVGLGFFRPLLDGAAAASAQFVDGRALRDAVLHGAAADLPHAVAPAPSAVGWIVGSVSGAASLAVAWLALHHRRTRVAATPAPGIMRPLRDAHSGHVGEYVLWLAAGFVTLGGAFLVGLS